MNITAYFLIFINFMVIKNVANESPNHPEKVIGVVKYSKNDPDLGYWTKVLFGNKNFYQNEILANEKQNQNMSVEDKNSEEQETPSKVNYNGPLYRTISGNDLYPGGSPAPDTNCNSAIQICVGQNYQTYPCSQADSGFLEELNSEDKLDHDLSRFGIYSDINDGFPEPAGSGRYPGASEILTTSGGTAGYNLQVSEAGNNFGESGFASATSRYPGYDKQNSKPWDSTLSASWFPATSGVPGQYPGASGGTNGYNIQFTDTGSNSAGGPRFPTATSRYPGVGYDLQFPEDDIRTKDFKFPPGFPARYPGVGYDLQFPEDDIRTKDFKFPPGFPARYPGVGYDLQFPEDDIRTKDFKFPPEFPAHNLNYLGYYPQILGTGSNTGAAFKYPGAIEYNYGNDALVSQSINNPGGVYKFPGVTSRYPGYGIQFLESGSNTGAGSRFPGASGTNLLSSQSINNPGGISKFPGVTSRYPGYGTQFLESGGNTGVGSKFSRAFGGNPGFNQQFSDGISSPGGISGFPGTFRSNSGYSPQSLGAVSGFPSATGRYSRPASSSGSNPEFGSPFLEAESNTNGAPRFNGASTELSATSEGYPVDATWFSATSRDNSGRRNNGDSFNSCGTY